MKFKGLFIAAAVAGGGALVLDECSTRPPPPPPKAPAKAPEPVPMAAHESPFSSIYVVFNSWGRFFGAAAVSPLHADRDASKQCRSGPGTKCYAVNALTFGVGDLRGAAVEKTCIAIGVDFLNTDRLKPGEKPTEYVIVRDPDPQGARDKIRDACADQPKKCALGRFVYCNYPALEPHNTAF